jgi:uncharacterized membrane protein YphA (DoxX/SURF4 family)
MLHKNKLEWILVASMALVFGFFGVDKFVHPEIWMGWFPGWMDGLFGLDLAKHNMMAAVTEITFAVLLIIPKTRFWGALGMTLQLAFIVVVLTRFSDIGIRDIGLLGMAVYLAAANNPWKKLM